MFALIIFFKLPKYKTFKLEKVWVRVSRTTKGGFFSESAIRFFNLQISKKNIPKNYPELEI